MTSVGKVSIDMWLKVHRRTLDEFIYIINHANPDCEEARTMKDFCIFTLAMVYGVERFYNENTTQDKS